MKNRFLLFVVYLFVFATGATGLIYQVTWQKYLSRLLGADSIATAIILGTFLGGLSFGYLIFGKWSTKIRNHFKAYALLEGIIGIWCLFFPQIFSLVKQITRGWEFSPPVLILVQGFAGSALLLGIPTLCMGGTLPFLTRGISRNISDATGVHARLYSINTAGAFVGTLLAGFYLIPTLGLPVTVMEAAFINLFICLAFYVISYFQKPHPDPGLSGQKEDPHPPPSLTIAASPYPNYALYLIAFLSGFYVMTLENVLIRITNLSLGSSSYSFSLIIAVFILAIAVGSYLVGIKKRISPATLFANQLLITVLLLAVYLTLDSWPYYAHLIRILFQSTLAGFWGYYLFILMGLTLLLILPVGLMGATIPLAFHEIKRDLANVGKHSGFLFSWNTVGSLFGSLVGGILLFYILSSGKIFLVATLLAALSTLLAGRFLNRKYRIASLVTALLVGMVLLINPAYKKENFAFGTFRQREALPFSFAGPRNFFRHYQENTDLQYYRDGPTATVAVSDNARVYGVAPTRAMSIVVNGKSDSDIYGDRHTLKISAHLSALLAARRQRAMVIGLGTGVTAGELTLYPEFQRIDVAEISPYVVKALPYFSHANHDLLHNPRVKIHVGDAFRILTRGEQKWDVIVSEPTNPWVTGVDLLFTEEFYRLVKRHLTPGGVLLQWIQRYSFNRDLIGMVLNTLGHEFQNVRIFNSNNSDLLVIATNRRFSRSDLEESAFVFNQNPRVRKSLKDLQIHTFTELLIRECWTSSYIRHHFADAGIQSMDYPRLHYWAGKIFFIGENDTSRLYDYRTTPFRAEYLLTRFSPRWRDGTSAPPEFEAILHRSKTPALTLLSYTPLVGLGYLNGTLPEISPDPHSRLFHRYLPLITGGKATGNFSPDPEFNRLPIRRQVEELIGHLKMFQSWLLHYPVDGLLSLLSDAHSQAPPGETRTWLGLQWLSVLLQENRPPGDILRLLREFPPRALTAPDILEKVLLDNQAPVIIRLFREHRMLRG